MRVRRELGVKQLQTALKQAIDERDAALEKLKVAREVLEWMSLDYDFYSIDEFEHALEIDQKKAREALRKIRG